MGVDIRPATLRDLSFTAANAREIDRREILASGPRSMTECAVICWSLIQTVGGAAWTVWLDGNPEYAFGFTRQTPLLPGLWSAWAWGSEKTGIVMPAMARWGHDELLPAVDRLGMVRIEARSIADHKDAHRWLLWMGFRHETDLPGYGRDGERFVLFSWVRSDFYRGVHLNVHGIAASAATAAQTAARNGQRHSGPG